MDVSDRWLQVLLTQQEYRRIPSNPPVRATTLRVRPLFLTQQAKILTTLLLFVRIFAFAGFVRGLNRNASHVPVLPSKILFTD